MGPLLRRTLESNAIALDLTTDRDALRRENLTEYDVLVDYTTNSTLTNEQRRGVVSFVEAGGGYAAFIPPRTHDRRRRQRDEPVPELRELGGGHFVMHPDPGTFDVNVVDTNHPVSAGLEGFEVGTNRTWSSTTKTCRSSHGWIIPRTATCPSYG